MTRITPPPSGPTRDALLGFFGMSSSVVDTVPRWATATTVVTPVSGTVYATYFTPLVDLTVGTITVHSSVSNAASGLTLAKMGLYTAAANGDLTLVARSASNTSLLSALNTQYDEALATAGGFPASYALVTGTRYAVGIIQVGTTPGRMVATASGGTSVTYGDDSPPLTAIKAGETDIAGNLASLAVNPTSAPYFRLS